MKRREFIKTSLIASSAVAMAGCAKKDIKVYSPNSLESEFIIGANGKSELNPNIRFAFSKCFGCFNVCGVRARIDKKTNQIQRLCGNPYSPANSDKPLPLLTPVKDALLSLGANTGLENRSTICGRGNAVIDVYKDKHRITKCLKRAGKRGENKWKSISYEQLIHEVVHGGNLFGEGEVEGLKDIRDFQTYANERYKDFGSKTNRVLMSGNAELSIRWEFYTRFAKNIFGTVNIGNKSAYCGHQQVAGVGLGCFDGTTQGALPSIDYEHCKYAIFIGTNPGLSGISLNAVGRRLADAKKRRDFKFIVVDPILRGSVNEAGKNNGEWIPIKSGTDTALMFALLSYIINNKMYFKKFLQAPSQSAADKISQVNFTNATYLVVKTKGHKLYNKFLRANLLGLGSEDEKVVMLENGNFSSSNTNELANLYFDGEVTLKDESKIYAVSAFCLLKKRVNEKSLDFYANYCNISKEKIIDIATNFAKNAPKVGIETNTGCNASDGCHFAYAATLLNTIAGSHNAKGGVFHLNGVGMSSMYEIYKAPLYDFYDFEKVTPSGFMAERSGNYELSDEFKQKVKKGINPYPAEFAWTTTYTQKNTGEALIAHANENPYTFKAWISWSNNPIYNCSGLKNEVLKSIKDPKKLPLFIGVDPYINETNIYADYIVPDTLQYEEYASSRMWGSEYIGDVTCVPLCESKTQKNANNKSICMEQFLIDLSVKLKLRGLGKNAFKDKFGKSLDVFEPKDFYLRLFANIAHSGSVLPTPTKEDLEYSSVDLIMDELAKSLKPDEVMPTAFLLSRGGRYEDFSSRYEGEFFNKNLRMDTQFLLYNEGLTKVKDSFKGEFFDGQPIFDEDVFFNKDKMSKYYKNEEYPFRFSSFKTHLRSPYSVVLPRITALSPTNFIHVNSLDAQKLNLKSGDIVKIISPKDEVQGVLEVSDGVAPFSVVIPTGFGHSAFGAKDLQIDSEIIKAEVIRGKGIEVNAFNISDPTRKGASLYRDQIFGCTARHGVPVKIVKV